MKLYGVASEVHPFAKTGGLADVVGALSKALRRRGHEVRIALPLYRQVDRSRWSLVPTTTRVVVPLGSERWEARVWEATLPSSDVLVYFIEQAALFDRDGLYQDGGVDYPDNLRRFSVFSQAALSLLTTLDWQPELLHGHDWQTALALAHLTWGSWRTPPGATDLARIFTVHNLAYQGVFPKAQWPLTGLPEEAFAIEGLEYYQQVNCLKGGLLAADLVTTVSPTYAQDIQTPEFGCGLDGVLRRRHHELIGILNGIDVEEWDPATDPAIAARYSADHPAGKALCKLALQRRRRLPEVQELLIGMVQRLAEQKGMDLVIQAAEELMRLPVQLVVLGTGDPVYHQRLEQLAAQFPQRLSVHLGFDAALAHQIEAGADAFLMPSRFEPCGLNQLYSMRYGTVPIVRRVGGLADTVTDVTQATRADRTATGFLFEEYTPRALIEAVKRAVTAFRDQALWTSLMQAGMRQDFSWDRSARAYEAVYARALSSRQPSAGRPAS
jgi:starch synthase